MRRKSVRKGIFGILYITILFMTVGMSVYGVRQDRTQKEIAEKILRFHVRANSDSSEDQTLKLKIRDAVGSLMGKKLAEAEDKEMCRDIVEENMQDIIHTAEQVIAEEGYDYSVSAYVSNVDFPVKRYGSYTFPAGKYEALEVVIGAGMGENWWCVMYPNMCFEGSVYEVEDEHAKEALQETLTEEEYESLLSGKEYEISFKYLRFLDKYLK